MEFLAETDGNRVLHLGPSHFDHMVEFRRFVAEGFMQAEKLFFQFFQQPERRHFSGGGDHVVGGLAAVYVIVGIDQRIIAFFAAQDLDGPVGDDFVGVHVQGGAGAALDRIHDKIVMEFSCDDLVAGLDNGGGSLFIKNSDLAVGDGRGFFYVSQAVDDLGMHVKACNRKVLRGAEGLYSVVNVFRNIFYADGIFFPAVVGCMCIHCVLSPSPEIRAADGPGNLFCCLQYTYRI